VSHERGPGRGGVGAPRGGVPPRAAAWGVGSGVHHVKIPVIQAHVQATAMGHGRA